MLGFCCQREPFSTHSSEEGIEADANNQQQLHFPHRTIRLCKELHVLKVFDMFYVAEWKFYYKLMHNNFPAYLSTMEPTLPTVCSRYEIRIPVFHLPYIRHTFAEHSVRIYLINLLNKDTCSPTIMERVDADPFLSFKLYLKRQTLESYKNACTIVNCHVCR